MDMGTRNIMMNRRPRHNNNLQSGSLWCCFLLFLSFILIFKIITKVLQKHYKSIELRIIAKGVCFKFKLLQWRKAMNLVLMIIYLIDRVLRIFEYLGKRPLNSNKDIVTKQKGRFKTIMLNIKQNKQFNNWFSS